MNKIEPKYIHTSVFTKQTAKRPGEPCGDVVEVYRDDISTNIVLADGIGSGLKANIYARMCCSRIVQLMKCGASLKQCFDAVGKTMNQAWGTDQPFAVFTIARILQTGKTTVMCYDMPAPIFVGQQYADVLESRTYYWEKAQIIEAHLQLDKHEGLALMSDGITQAGMGLGLVHGWLSEGVAKYINHRPISVVHNFTELAERIHRKAVSLWGKRQMDDCTVVMAYNWRGVTMNILTGTPINRDDDTQFVKEFTASEGIKVVCGGSTSKMYAREVKKPISIEEEGSALTPPSYKIPGITLATEGIVTLNQIYNLLSEDIEYPDGRNVVVELADLLQNTDKVVFWVGEAVSQANNTLEMKQLGIVNRLKIVELIAEKLRQMNKVVIVKR